VGEDGEAETEFDQLRPYRAFETIVEAIRERIADRRLANGQRLPAERELAAQFGVSRPTLREAFRVLESMGLVESRMGSGRYIVSPAGGDPAESAAYMGERGLLPFIEFLLGIEPYLAMLAARRATDSDLRRIETTLRSERPDRRDEAAADTSFHLAVTEAAHNRVARDVLQSERVALYWADLWVSVIPASHAAILAEHEAVYRAIGAHDEAAAGDEMRRHLEAALDRVRRASRLQSGESGYRRAASGHG